MKKNVAVLLAGGSGSRMGADRPKQFIEVMGKTILEWSIIAFSRIKEIDEVCIVCRKDWMDEVRTLVEQGKYEKVTHILPGGRERYDSSLSAIGAYANDNCMDDNKRLDDNDVRLLLHDSVRPLVSERIIRDCIKALDDYEAVDVAIPSTDTIIEVNEEGIITRTPKRSLLRNVQTPQGFRLGTIRRAYELALQDPAFQTTDDCGVVFRYLPETQIKVIEGETTNIKITYPQDILMMEQVLSKN